MQQSINNSRVDLLTGIEIKLSKFQYTMQINARRSKRKSERMTLSSYRQNSHRIRNWKNRKSIIGRENEEVTSELRRSKEKKKKKSRPRLSAEINELSADKTSALRGSARNAASAVNSKLLRVSPRISHGGEL